MSHRIPHLNAARRRARKRTLARRDGARCFYCLLPFTDLRAATMDHVVPYCLYRTWSAGDLVLACRPCNTAKADRLSLLLALLLCAVNARVNTSTGPFTAAPAAMNTTVLGTPAVNAAVNTESVPVNAVNATVNTHAVTEVTGRTTGIGVWLTLARLAAENARTSVTARVTPGVTSRPADPTGERSTPTLHESISPVRTRSTGRPDCLRAPRPVRACVGPTGEAVFA